MTCPECKTENIELDHDHDDEAVYDSKRGSHSGKFSGLNMGCHCNVV